MTALGGTGKSAGPEAPVSCIDMGQEAFKAAARLAVALTGCLFETSTIRDVIVTLTRYNRELVYEVG